MAVQHVPSRAHLLPRLLDALGDDWYSLDVVTGDPELRDPWATYRDCLVCAEPAVLAPTHLLVVQDDALLVERFAERVTAAVAGRPRDLLCLYVPERPSYMGRAIIAAAGKGEPYAIIPGGMFVPLVAAVWPAELARRCLAWALATPTSLAKRCDDAQVARYFRTVRYRPVGVVPSLVEHDEQTPSTLGLGRYKRTAALLG